MPTTRPHAVTTENANDCEQEGGHPSMDLFGSPDAAGYAFDTVNLHADVSSIMNHHHHEDEHPDESIIAQGQVLSNMKEDPDPMYAPPPPPPPQPVPPQVKQEEHVHDPHQHHDQHQHQHDESSSAMPSGGSPPKTEDVQIAKSALLALQTNENGTTTEPPSGNPSATGTVAQSLLALCSDGSNNNFGNSTSASNASPPPPPSHPQATQPPHVGSAVAAAPPPPLQPHEHPPVGDEDWHHHAADCSVSSVASSGQRHPGGHAAAAAGGGRNSQGNGSHQRFTPEQQARWDEMFARLLEYKDKHGHTKVPESYEDTKLANWVGNQRRAMSRMRRGVVSYGLDPRRIEMLEEVGFEWAQARGASTPGAYERRSWEDMFQRLVDFKDANGHTKVPNNFRDKRLVTWVANQRKAMSRKLRGLPFRCINQEKVEMLDSIAFVWSVPHGGRSNNKAAGLIKAGAACAAAMSPIPKAAPSAAAATGVRKQSPAKPAAKKRQPAKPKEKPAPPPPQPPPPPPSASEAHVPEKHDYLSAGQHVLPPPRGSQAVPMDVYDTAAQNQAADQAAAQAAAEFAEVAVAGNLMADLSTTPFYHPGPDPYGIPPHHQMHHDPLAYQPGHEHHDPQHEVHHEPHHEPHHEVHHNPHQQPHHDPHQQPHHDPHQQPHHDPHQQPHHDPHQQPHHEVHHEPHHEVHHEPHHDPHHQPHHEMHHEVHHEPHHEMHHEMHHEVHHEPHHDPHHQPHHEPHHQPHHEPHHHEPHHPHHHDPHHAAHHDPHHDAHHEAHHHNELPDAAMGNSGHDHFATDPPPSTYDHSQDTHGESDSYTAALEAVADNPPPTSVDGANNASAQHYNVASV